MKITFNWLNSFIDLKIKPDELADLMSMIGLEVEEIIDKSKIYGNFVVAEIKGVTKHPEAEKLHICEVFDGKKTLQIVCGANNVKKGLKVVLAPVGTIMPLNKMKIKTTKIRGVESSGMLCAESELFENDTDDRGIIEINADNVEIGMLYADLIGIKDQIININITPNRGDALSLYGIARDLYAKGVGELKDKYTNFQKLTLANQFKTQIDAQILDQKNCQEIAFMKICGLNNMGPVNSGITAYFNCLELKKHTSLVTISNFAMYELGRPNHIYDADKINGKILVRPSVAGEKFISLEPKEYELPAGILVIADSEKILSVAGVMGGEASKVEANTKNIIVEVANFCPIQVLKSVKALHLRTESSHRFERRIDFGNTERFFAYIANLINSECGGKIKAVNFFQGEQKPYQKEIAFNLDKVNTLYGININHNTAQEVMEKLGFIFNEYNKTYSIPTWRRGDIEDQSDLAEEIIRMSDFQAVGEKVNQQLLPTANNADIIKTHLVNRGFFEQISWSFIKQEHAVLFSDLHKHIALENPISNDFAVMRPCLLPGLISIAKKNLARSIETMSFLEAGKVYSLENKECSEIMNLAAIKLGNASEKKVHNPKREYDFFDIKDDLLSALAQLQINEAKLRFISNASTYYHPGKSAAVYLGKNLLAYVGAIHPKILQQLDCNSAVYAFELFTDNLAPKNFEKKKGAHFSDLQRIKRDFSFLVDQNITCADMQKSVRSRNIDLIDKVEFFDVFQSLELKNKKSVAFSIYIQPKKQNLNEAEIHGISDQVITKVQDDFNAVLRG